MADRQMGFQCTCCPSYSPMDDVAGAIELSRTYAKLHCNTLLGQIINPDNNYLIAARIASKTTEIVHSHLSYRAIEILSRFNVVKGKASLREQTTCSDIMFGEPKLNYYVHRLASS